MHRCRWKLFGCRRAACDAVVEGFTSLIDLSTQLAAFTTAERVRLLQGEPRLSSAALVGCFDWSKGKSRDGDVARFDSEALPELAKTAAMLRSLLSDDTAFDEARRRQLLLWTTALPALPAGGLGPDNLLTLAEAEAEPAAAAAAGRLPIARTCARELVLPPYASREALRERLCFALDHSTGSFDIQ